MEYLKKYDLFLVYIDGILVASNSIKEHEQHLDSLKIGYLFRSRL